MQTTAEQKELVRRSLALVAPVADTAAPVAVPQADHGVPPLVADGAPGSALRPPGDTPIARALSRGAAPV